MVMISVYPRWRGEHSSCSWPARHTAGLSPLARGTRKARDQAARGERFIPAGAGNTSLIRSSNAVEPVYPRWRGEHAAAIDAIAAVGGLSPLARGTH